jgi:hypothetical protein
MADELAGRREQHCETQQGGDRALDALPVPVCGEKHKHRTRHIQVQQRVVVRRWHDPDRSDAKRGDLIYEWELPDPGYVESNANRGGADQVESDIPVREHAVWITLPKKAFEQAES